MSLSAVNRCVLSSRLNCSRLRSGCRSLIGKLFHVLGPATAKQRSPRDEWVRSGWWYRLLVSIGERQYTTRLSTWYGKPSQFSFPVYYIYVEIFVISTWFREHAGCAPSGSKSWRRRWTYGSTKTVCSLPIELHYNVACQCVMLYWLLVSTE